MKKPPFQRYFLIPLTLGLLSSTLIMPLSARAQTDTKFTPEQRQQIISVVRQALKDDPTILEDAVIAAQQERTKQRNAMASKTLDENKNLLMKLLPTDGMLGNPNAKNTIIEFYDPRCPYCKKVLPELIQLAKENKDVRIIFKAVPILGENSVLQSQAIVASARQNSYVRMMNAIMDSKETITLDVIKKLAQQQKMDADQLVKDMKAASVTKALENDIQLLRDLGIEGTPALIINGTKIIPGAVSYDDLKKIIQQTSK